MKIKYVYIKYREKTRFRNKFDIHSHISIIDVN